MSDDTIQKLEALREQVSSMENIKGKRAVIAKIRSSILFLQMHKIDKCNADLIVKAREKDIEYLNKGKEYKQAEIDWRAPKHLRD